MERDLASLLYGPSSRFISELHEWDKQDEECLDLGITSLARLFTCEHLPSAILKHCLTFSKSMEMLLG